MIEMGPEAGAGGGTVIAEGTIGEIEESGKSVLGPFLSGKADTCTRVRANRENMFEYGKIHISTGNIHTVKPLSADIPKGRMTVVTGVSGSGKTTFVLESLIPAMMSCERSLREHRTRTVLGIRPGISLTIRENSAALDVTEQA